MGLSHLSQPGHQQGSWSLGNLPSQCKSCILSRSHFSHILLLECQVKGFLLMYFKKCQNCALSFICKYKFSGWKLVISMYSTMILTERSFNIKVIFKCPCYIHLPSVCFISTGQIDNFRGKERREFLVVCRA